MFLKLLSARFGSQLFCILFCLVFTPCEHLQWISKGTLLKLRRLWKNLNKAHHCEFSKNRIRWVEKILTCVSHCLLCSFHVLLTRMTCFWDWHTLQIFKANLIFMIQVGWHLKMLDICMLRNLLNNYQIENSSCKPFLDHCLNSVHDQFNMLLLTHRVTYYKNIYSCWCLPLNPINFDVDIAIITKHVKVVYFHNYSFSMQWLCVYVFLSKAYYFMLCAHCPPAFRS